MIATLYVSTTHVPFVIPAWVYAVAMVSMLASLSAIFADLRTPKARLVLAGLVLAIAFSSAGHALMVGDPCGQAHGLWFYLIGCAF